MKTGGALLLSTFLAALCGSFVNGNGVCYDPDHALGAKGEASIIKDMQSIRQKGFTHVRTYISKFGNTEMAKIIRDQGMTLALGVPYGNPDYEEQLKSAVAVAQGGNVKYIFVGNENLRGSVPASFIQEIRRVKALVPGSVKVGTVQRNTEFLEKISGLTDLINACDAIGINIHPFFTAGQNTAEKAMALTKDHWTKALGIAGDKLILTETGWPTQGSFAGNQGSNAMASGYFGAYNAWSAVPGDKRFYFQMFDQPTRAENFEQAYGIFTKDRTDKFNVAVNPAPVPAPAPAPVHQLTPTAAPTAALIAAPSAAPGTTPTPTTAAPGSTPTPTPTPTPVAGVPIPSLSNSTSQTSGSSASSASHDLTHGSGSKSFGVDTGVTGSQSTTSSSGTSTAGNSDATQSGGAAATPAPAIVSNGHGDPVIASDSDKTQYAGGSSTETNSKSAGAGGATTVVFAVAAGCVAVVAAFGFIYHTRKKAAELEEAEAKESVAITPHNSCVL